MLAPLSASKYLNIPLNTLNHRLTMNEQSVRISVNKFHGQHSEMMKLPHPQVNTPSALLNLRAEAPRLRIDVFSSSVKEPWVKKDKHCQTQPKSF